MDMHVLKDGNTFIHDKSDEEYWEYLLKKDTEELEEANRKN